MGEFLKKDHYLQAVRGVAIAAVVAIHCLPLENWAVFARPFLNFSVATFIFLSGYLTPRKKIGNIGMFYKKRLGKIAAPYVLWTLFYTLAQGAAPLMILFALLTGSGAAQLYFLIVYLQLILLTPLLYQLLDIPIIRFCLYSLTPCMMLFWYSSILFGIDSMRIGSFFGTWVIFYLLGLEWKSKILPWLQGKNLTFRKMVIVFVCCVVLQELEGLLWLSFGSFDLATTQLKISSMLTSAAFIVMSMSVGCGLKQQISHSRVLAVLGDCSFGVYLFHIVPIIIWSHFLAVEGPGYAFVEWGVVLVVSVLTVWASRRIVPKTVLLAIGFR